MLHTSLALPSDLVSVQDGNQKLGWSYQTRLAILAWAIVLGFCLFCSSSLAWGEDFAANKKIVAAGFGYQIGSASVIAVKVYDAESGAILSDEVYELSVKENGGGGANPGPRIFAGGVGLGATDLSNFMLRVYDANTGVFQWEGRLNLVQPDKKKELQVSVTVPRRATVLKIQADEAASEQPIFLLRAVDATSGLSVWEDEFTANLTGIPRVRPITGRSVQSADAFIGSAHTFDFRIRMYDSSGKGILWEDQLSPVESEEEPTESFGDHASMLPAWPHQSQNEEVPAESI